MYYKRRGLINEKKDNNDNSNSCTINNYIWGTYIY